MTDQRDTAIHEAGHAVMATRLDERRHQWRNLPYRAGAILRLVESGLKTKAKGKAR